MRNQSVKSINPCLAGRQACKSVIQTSYDIVNKGHGGELKVESKEACPDDPFGGGEGSELIIKLPLA